MASIVIRKLIDSCISPSRFRRAESGNVTLIAAIVAVPVIGSTGVAIDYLRANRIATEVGSALDGAVLAGATATSDYAGAAKRYFAANLPFPQARIASYTFTKTGTTRIDGTVSLDIPTSFSSILGVRSIRINLASAAQSTPGGSSLCLIALSPNESQAFLVNSGANVDAPTCEMDVKSTANPAAIFNSGATIKTQKLCIEGTNIINNGGTVTGRQTGCPTPADPYAGKIPAPVSTVCDYSNMNYSGTVTINPGTYCGWTNFNSGSNVTLRPGTYIIKSGGWNVNGGTWTGSGVTFYFADTSKIQFNSAVKATLSAPTSGTYKDVLFAETSGLSPSQFIFDDSLGFTLTGILYLPSREVVFNSGSTTRSQSMTAVVRKVIFNSTKWTLTPYGGGGSGAAKMARLVK